MSRVYNNLTEMSASYKVAVDEQNGADIAWVLVSTMVVFLMTPANGYFYAGTVEFKNAMSVILICLLCIPIVSIQWWLFGFSLAFSENATNGFIGDFTHAAFNNVGVAAHPSCPTIPSLLFAVYQLMFAIVTAALSMGSIAERVRIGPFAVFVFIWTTVVYDVITYWAWGTHGWAAVMGMQDFAGGLPVHITSGFTGLALAVCVGRRTTPASMPHNLTYTALGTALFWFGWFGFNGGSECALNIRAVNAMTVTHLSACFGALTWIIWDYRLHQRITSLGFCSGAIAGLVCMTPASGFAPIWASPIFGILGAWGANNACFLKTRFNFDDALDVFAVHGVAGLIGSVLTAIFSSSAIQGSSFRVVNPPGGFLDRNFFQIVANTVPSLVGAVYAFLMTCLIVFAMKYIRLPVIGSLDLRMSQDDEAAGTDFALMGEVAYDFTHSGQKQVEAMAENAL